MNPLMARRMEPRATRSASEDVVTNVVAQQIQGTGQVRITFDVSDADQVAVRLICSSDNGITFDLLPISVTGHMSRDLLRPCDSRRKNCQ